MINTHIYIEIEKVFDWNALSSVHVCVCMCAAY